MASIKELLQAELASYEPRKWTGTIAGQEVSLYAKPLSPNDVEKVRKKYPEFTTQPEPAAMVNVICDKAYTNPELEGSKAMSINIEGRYLKDAKVSLSGEIFTALFGDDFDDDTDLDGVVKNSKADQ